MIKLKKSFIILPILIGMFSTNVSAKEGIFYTNDNNVSLTEREYNFISNLFYDGFQNVMSQNDYDNIFWNENIINNEIFSNNYDESHNIIPYAASHETTSKILTIKSSCDLECTVTITAEWKTSPKVRSYDVIGAYLEGVNLTFSPITYAEGASETSYSSEIVQFNNGFGVSVKLPSSGSKMKVCQYFRVTKGGTVYGSYQHATSSISLANSKKYSISRSGYGGVFLFNDSVKSYYDAMGGVSISV